MKTLSIILICLTTLTSYGKTYYFSNAGSDKNKGTQESTFLTITKANAVMQRGDSMLYKCGDSFYGSIIPTQYATGTKGDPIYIGTYGSGAKPVITGLITITDWISIGNGLYEKTLTNPSLNMVLFNGKVQPIGRFPKAGLGDASYLYIKSHTVVKTGTAISSQTITSDNIPSDFTGGELVERTMQWAFDRSTISSQNSTTITSVRSSNIGHPSTQYESINGHGFFIQNHINTLTTLGDWSYNQNTKKITMYFGADNPNKYRVEVSTIGTLVDLTNKKYIKFSGLEFKGSNENAVQLGATLNIDFDSCNFHFSGINAIHTNTNNTNTQDIKITNCDFNNTLNNAIEVSGFPYWTIANNTIRNTGLIQGMGLSADGQYIGIFEVGANSIVEYNEIENTGYHGIHFKGNNTIVRYNHVHHYCIVKSDGGGIYTWEKTGKNRIIYKNIVHDGVGDRYGLGATDNPFSGQIHGIYNDGNTTDVTITDNTCFNNSHSGIWFGSNGEITATGNTCYNNKVAQIKGIDNMRNYSNINIKNNILFARDSGSLILSFNVRPASINALNMDSNYYCRPIWEIQGLNGISGYSTFRSNNKAGFDWNTYNDGATVETNNHFYSVDKWKAATQKDAHSKGVAKPDDIRFEYNATKESKSIMLEGKWIDVKGNYYSSVTLEPYSSIILLKVSETYPEIIQTILKRLDKLEGKN